MKGFEGKKPQIKFVLSLQEHFFSAPSQQGIRVCKLYGLLRDVKLHRSKVSPNAHALPNSNGRKHVLNIFAELGLIGLALPDAGYRGPGSNKALSTQRALSVSRFHWMPWKARTGAHEPLEGRSHRQYCLSGFKQKENKYNSSSS